MAVHRFKANEHRDDEEKVVSKKTKAVEAAPVKVVKKAAAKKTAEPRTRSRIKLPRFLKAIRDYFVGSWHELRQVRWPNRKQTWALTLAVILFSLIFFVLIFLLDTAYTILFKKVIF